MNVPMSIAQPVNSAGECNNDGAPHNGLLVVSDLYKQQQPDDHTVTVKVCQLGNLSTDVTITTVGKMSGETWTPVGGAGDANVARYNGDEATTTGTLVEQCDTLHNGAVNWQDTTDNMASGDGLEGDMVGNGPDDNLLVESPDNMQLLTKPLVDDGVYHCQLCSYTTDKKANWYKHKNRHSGRRQHMCELCPYRATTSSNLRRHKLIHEDVKGFKCPLCQLQFRQKIHLERHVKYKHQEKDIQCDHCDYRCATYNPDMKVHLWRKHMICDTDREQELLKCDECSFTTVLRRELRQHLKFHRRGPELKLYCSECCFVTDCSSRLQRHSLTHTRLRPYACTLCDYRASQKEHVTRHMNARHGVDVSTGRRKKKRADKSKCAPPDYCTREKLFACNMCTMKFAKLINLYKHVHAQHGVAAEGGELACVVCDYRGSSHKSLLVHMRKHTVCDGGSAPRTQHIYSCAVCSFTHVQREALHEHMRSEHQVQVVVSNGSVHCLVDYVEQESAVQLPDVPTPSSSSSCSQVVVQEGQDVKPKQLATDMAHMSAVVTDAAKTLEVPTLCAAEVNSSVNEDITKLSSGDIVEINGEMYRVELATPVTYE